MTLELADITKAFAGNGDRPETLVFDRFNLTVEAGRFVSVVGPSGCGKTTLLRLVAGLENADSGRVILGGRELSGPVDDIGFVFQEYALFPWRTARRNIEAGLEVTGVPPAERRERSAELVRRFGLAGFENHFPRELSGGMRQRVAIARTLIMNPQVVLMDEPFASLDSQTRNSMQEFLLEVWRDWGKTVLFVTHNVDEAVFLSDRVLVLSPRPAEVVAGFDLDQPRPRDRTSPAVNAVRREILETLKNQLVRGRTDD